MATVPGAKCRVLSAVLGAGCFVRTQRTRHQARGTVPSTWHTARGTALGTKHEAPGTDVDEASLFMERA